MNEKYMNTTLSKKYKLKMSISDEVKEFLMEIDENNLEASIDVVLQKAFMTDGNPAASRRKPATYLRRLYDANKKTRQDNFTWVEFRDYFIKNKKYIKLYKKYVDSLYYKPLAPSFIFASDLKDIKVMTYEKRMKHLSSKNKGILKD